MKPYIMALDQGTTSSRCIIFDRQGQIVSSAQKEFAQIYPKPGWVEQNPVEIWSSQLSVTMEALAALGAKPSDIAALGITNQRETVIVWNKKNGKPVYNAIVWQCRRTADQIEALKRLNWNDYIIERTGLLPDAYFSAAKLAWILEHVPGVREQAEKGELLFGTVDTWLIWNLTGRRIHATDYTNASRTMLFDIHKLCWDSKLLSYFKIPETMLPEVFPSGHVYGKTDAGILGGEILIGGAAGDQQAALFGQCCFEKGEVKNTYGTGCFLLMNTGEKAVESKKGLLTTLAAVCEGGKPQYALEGSVFVGGAAVKWLRDEMRLIRDAKQTELYAGRVEDTNGVYLVPAFTGLGAPYWNPYARGTVVGLSRGCKKEHFVRAVLESIAFQTAEVLSVMEKESGIPLKEIKVDGGASANDFLLQFQADMSSSLVKRPECIESTALGAAYLAGLSTGFFKDRQEIRKNWKTGQVFSRKMEDGEREKRKKEWEKAVRCALFWADIQDKE